MATAAERTEYLVVLLGQAASMIDALSYVLALDDLENAEGLINVVGESADHLAESIRLALAELGAKGVV